MHQEFIRTVEWALNSRRDGRPACGACGGWLYRTYYGEGRITHEPLPHMGGCPIPGQVARILTEEQFDPGWLTQALLQQEEVG